MIFTAISNGEYSRMTKKASPPTNKIKNGILAFLVGGLICTIGEGAGMIYAKLGLGQDDIKLLIPVTLVVLASVLTALGVFDKIAYFAGAGTVVPITGFANAVSSPAIDARSEGFVLGVGAKIFTVAGPVLLYGTVAGVIYGVIYYVFTVMI